MRYTLVLRRIGNSSYEEDRNSSYEEDRNSSYEEDRNSSYEEDRNSSYRAHNLVISPISHLMAEITYCLSVPQIIGPIGKIKYHRNQCIFQL